MEISAPEPSDDTMLAYLQAEQKNGYYFDSKRYGKDLEDVTLIAISGPTAAGKSTLVRAASEAHDIAQLQSSMTRSMEDRDAHEPHHRFEVPLQEFYDAVAQRSIVNFFVNRNNHVYGTFTSGFSKPLTIGAIGVDTLEQLGNAGFRDVRALYTVMSGEDYAARLGLDRIHQADIVPRLHEGLDSLDFAERNLQHAWLTPIRLSNEPGELERAAEDVGKISHHHSLQTLSTYEAIRFIGEMRAVAQSALARIALQ